MNRVVLSIGSNSLDCCNQMVAAFEWLKHILNEAVFSKIYETPALNGKDKNYLNAVVAGYLDEDFETARMIMKQYERDCGRTPESKVSGSIPIDIDIVMWNDEIVKESDYRQSYFQIGWNELLETLNEK